MLLSAHTLCNVTRVIKYFKELVYKNVLRDSTKIVHVMVSFYNISILLLIGITFFCIYFWSDLDGWVIKVIDLWLQASCFAMG